MTPIEEKQLQEALDLEIQGVIDTIGRIRSSQLQRLHEPAKRAVYFDTCLSRGPGIGFFRLLGFGLYWKDTSRHRLYFSERNGHQKAIIVGKWRIRLLTPWR